MLDSITISRDHSEHSLSSQLRAAILNSGHTRYAISKATGIDQATLSRFVKGSVNGAVGGLSLKAIDLIAHYLDLALVVRPAAEPERAPSDGIAQQGHEGQSNNPICGGEQETPIDPPWADSAEGGGRDQGEGGVAERGGDLPDQLGR